MFIEKKGTVSWAMIIMIILCTIPLVSTGCGSISVEIDPDNQATRVTSRNGITMVYIDRTSFLMGNSESRNIDTKPQKRITLTPYHISSSEITNAQYVTFLNDAFQQNMIVVEIDENNGVASVVGKLLYGGRLYARVNYGSGLSDGISGINYEDSTFSPVLTLAEHPVTEVSWYGAMGYARHLGFSLPTEAQWECAARAGSQENYGTKTGSIDIRGEFANFGNIVGDTREVRSYPPNKFGLYDMSGNVREWCADVYSPGFYRNMSEKDPYNKKTVYPEDSMVVRGGSFQSERSETMTSYRHAVEAGTVDKVTGFRVVYNVPSQ